MGRVHDAAWRPCPESHRDATGHRTSRALGRRGQPREQGATRDRSTPTPQLSPSARSRRPDGAPRADGGAHHRRALAKRTQSPKRQGDGRSGKQPAAEQASRHHGDHRAARPTSEPSHLDDERDRFPVGPRRSAHLPQSLTVAVEAKPAARSPTGLPANRGRGRSSRIDPGY